MNNLFNRLTGRQPPSRQVAKDRLKLVLIHDRTDVSPAVLEQLKDELIAVISKFVDIDRDGVDIKLTQEQTESRLVADIPLLKSPRRRR
ncbi:MAG: cell division topological specificity factor MinE [Chloroflexi bacterium]|nr:cell division topological specificity factor MinE [Chloroflexota bacterium]MBI2975736.1 cell division topological specificity factor MinE [Chloroflexota bacterium]MBI4316124.1 cell division topological specificity factor MinE [Chloroflexota bacterium]MBI5291019.1 cell division topological specificity factor MinE [Chloroflexota bacterium]MBI5829095.1 cell division topological specificity factor MinE [Chloroflexota bacterium]